MLKIVHKYVEEITRLLSEGVSGGDWDRREIFWNPGTHRESHANMTTRTHKTLKRALCRNSQFSLIRQASCEEND